MGFLCYEGVWLPLRWSVPSLGQAVAQHQAQRFLSSGGLKILLAPMSVGAGYMVLAVDQMERTPWCRGLVLAVEVVRETLLQIRSVADVPLAVGLAVKDIDAVAEFGKLLHCRILPKADARSK